MKLHGGVEENLVAAVRSARRFRGHPVHADTLRHWNDLLQHARREHAAGLSDNRHSVEQLIIELESELASRIS
jgi:hypothetical protein